VGSGITNAGNLFYSLVTGNDHAFNVGSHSACVIAGSGITTNWGSSRSLIAGGFYTFQTNSAANDSVVVGRFHDFGDSISDSILAGVGLTLNNHASGSINGLTYTGKDCILTPTQDISYSFLGGEDNEIHHKFRNSVLVGNTNVLNDAITNCLIAGESLTTTVGSLIDSSLLLGNTIDVTGPVNDSFLMGNTISTAGVNGSFGFGTGVVLDHDYAVVFSDSNGLPSADIRRFHAGFSGGYVFYTDAGRTTGATMYANQGSWSSLSSEQYKENFEEVDYKSMLQKFDNVDIKKWSYKDKTERNIGITAEDFYGIVGEDVADQDDRISTSDSDGVIYSLMKGMYEEIKKLQEEIKQLQK
jgi:hypothetical protein